MVEGLRDMGGEGTRVGEGLRDIGGEGLGWGRS